MVDFINEVEEELRKDKYNALLRKFGPLIVAVIFAIVAVAGFIEFKKYSVSKTARATAASYTSASKLVETGEKQAAIEKFIAISEVSPSGYAGLSLSRAAALKTDLGEFDDAVKLYDRSAQAFEHRMHQDLSSLKSIYILLSQGRHDDVIARTGLLIGEDAPYEDLAKEVMAHALLKTGKSAQAKTHFTYLANSPGVLAGVKTRAKQSLLLLNANQTIEPPTDLLPNNLDESTVLDEGTVEGETTIQEPELVQPNVQEPKDQK